jgi:hypothetical protein
VRSPVRLASANVSSRPLTPNRPLRYDAARRRRRRNQCDLQPVRPAQTWLRGR